MSSTSVEKLKKQLQVFKVVFGGLVLLTLVTAGISRTSLGGHTKIYLCMTIAAVQAIFSAGYFMHLNSEKKSIWWFLILTAFFFVTLLLLPILTFLDPIKN